MGSKLIKFELNSAGVRDLLQGSEMQNVLMEYAHQVADSAGDGFDVYVGPTRANVSVSASTEEAYERNLDENTLEKAVRS